MTNRFRLYAVWGVIHAPPGVSGILAPPALASCGDAQPAPTRLVCAIRPPTDLVIGPGLVIDPGLVIGPGSRRQRTDAVKNVADPSVAADVGAELTINANY